MHRTQGKMPRVKDPCLNWWKQPEVTIGDIYRSRMGHGWAGQGHMHCTLPWPGWAVIAKDCRKLFQCAEKEEPDVLRLFAKYTGGLEAQIVHGLAHGTMRSTTAKRIEAKVRRIHTLGERRTRAAGQHGEHAVDEGGAG